MRIRKISLKLPKVMKKPPVDVPAVKRIKTPGIIAEKVLAVLCYLGIFALIPILWSKKSQRLKTHASSGIVILALWAALLFVFQIPLLGVVLGILLLIGEIIFSIWGIYDALTNQEAKIPGIEKIALFIAD